MTADIDSVALELARANREHHEAEAALAAASSRLERAREQLRAAEPILVTSTGIDLDDDPRDPDTQAADFFTRAGDFHQVDIAIPLDDEPLGLKLGAQFVIKFTPDQKPLIIEVLRQLRGALAARITITRMEETTESDIAGGNSTPNVAIDNDTELEQWLAFNQRTEEKQRAIIAACQAARAAADHEEQKNRAAAHFGVPPDQLTPIRMSNGQTAWTHTQPPATAAGRHHKPEEHDGFEGDDQSGAP